MKENGRRGSRLPLSSQRAEPLLPWPESLLQKRGPVSRWNTEHTFQGRAMEEGKEGRGEGMRSIRVKEGSRKGWRGRALDRSTEEDAPNCISRSGPSSS